MSLLVSCEYGQSFKAENRKAPVQKRCKGTEFSSATNGSQENMRHPYVRAAFVVSGKAMCRTLLEGATFSFLQHQRTNHSTFSIQKPIFPFFFPRKSATRARGSLTNSERKTETSDFGTKNCHCGLGVREADFLTHPIKKRGCTERRCSPFVVSELGQWLLPIIFGRGPTAAVIHFLLVRKLFVACLRTNLKGLSNHPFGLDFVGLRTGREIYLFVHDVCTV